jgi:glycosyltransferase involved in cell wall biosynthesis
MRILIATEYAQSVGGVETYIRSLCPHLVRLGHVVSLGYRTEVPDRAPIAPDLPAWPLDDSSKTRSFCPDIVFLQGLADPAIEADLAAQYPTVLFAHNYHGACISGTKCFSNRNFRTCTRSLGPGCLVRFLPAGCGGRHPLTMIQQYRRQRRHGRNLSLYRSVAVASRHMLEEYRRHGIDDTRLVLLPLFPTDQQADPVEPSVRPPSGRILFAGRLTEIKGVRLLPEALARASASLQRSLTLVVAGDGPERPSLDRIGREHRIPIEWLGWIERECLLEQFRLADLLAVPSLWPEPFGLVGLEAGCVGLPAVAFPNGGITDWLLSDQNGILAMENSSAASLAEAIVASLQDPVRWQRLRMGAWQTARKLTVEKHVAGLVSLLTRAACR